VGLREGETSVTSLFLPCGGNEMAEKDVIRLMREIWKDFLSDNV